MATWNTDKPALANQVTDDVPDIEENFQELHDVVEQLTNGTLGTTEPANFKVQLATASRVVVTDASKNLDVATSATETELETLVGGSTSDADALHTHDLKANLAVYKTIYLPATLWTPTTTSGCATLTSTEYATNDIQMAYLAFDGGSQEFACYSMPWPEDYDLGTLTAKFFWIPSADTGTAGETVIWNLETISVADDEAIDAAPSNVQVISDAMTSGENADLHITGKTPAITTGHTLGDLMHLKISRSGDSDTLSEDAWLFGVYIQYKTLTTTPIAWT